MAAVINISTARLGASPDDWQHLDMVLGLTQDLLPVVSNPQATIDPDSTMKGLGKTPSRYNAAGNAVGFGQWTQHITTPEEIARWAKQKDYGICIQTRRLRAIDIDVTDPEAAQAVAEAVERLVGQLPARTRNNSPKLLLAFECTGELTKRKFKSQHGIVELLATGQQFIAVGTHPSGARYQWLAGLPDEVPVLTLDQVNALWSALADEFAIEDAQTTAASVKIQKLSDVMALDPVAQHLLDAGVVLRSERDGRLHITCPFEDEHTSESSDTATTYWPAHTGGYQYGHFHCLHAHCEHRSDQEFKDAIHFVDTSIAEEFSAIAVSDDSGRGCDADHDPKPIQGDAAPQGPGAGSPTPKPPRFAVQPAHAFAQGKPPSWLIKGFLPKAELAVLFGESGSGKSFLALDLAVDIAMGTSWRGRVTRRGRVVYVAAEGAGGFRNRLKALAMHRCLDLDQIPVGIISDAPNMMEKADALEVAKAIVASGGADLVIIDTWAQVTPGANENSGEDMGRALAHCKGIHRATGALVMLVHHSGKDSSKGARGWSGLRAAADVELEVLRNENARSVTVTKLKDGEDGAELGFRLESVVLGLDEDQEEITSLVVEHTGGGAVRGRDRGPKGAVEKILVNCMLEMATLGDASVDRCELKTAGVNQLPHDPHEGKKDRRSERVDRAIESLVASGRLVVEGVRMTLAAGNTSRIA
jgi:hypothetical protein